jgi:hypothetical protein
MSNNTKHFELFTSAKERDALVKVLRENGISGIDVSFDGSGDSGSITDVNFYAITKDKNGEANATPVKGVCGIIVESWETYSSWCPTRGYERETRRDTTTLQTHIERIVDDALDRTGIDWYNNDGGFGECTITVTEDGALDFKIEVNARYTEVTTHNFNFSGMKQQESK